MNTHFAKILFVTTALIAVGACSSNNSNPVTGATDTPVIPPPAPGQPTPPASTQYSMATVPTGSQLSLTAHSGVEAFNFSNGASAAAESQPPAGSLVTSPTSSYVTTANGFTLTLPDGNAATFVTTGTSQAVTAQSLFPINATGSQRFQTNVNSGSNFVVASLSNAQNTGLAYSTYGTWAEYSAMNTPTTIGTLATGINTTTAQMPTSGTATYTGHLTGYAVTPTVGANITDGAVSLSANFSSNSVTGSITGITTVHGGASAVSGRMNDINLTGGSISGTGFSGSASIAAAAGATTVNVAGANGTFGGKFYGPGAAEAAGSLSLTGNGSTVIGAFGATKP